MVFWPCKYGLSGLQCRWMLNVANHYIFSIRPSCNDDDHMVPLI